MIAYIGVVEGQLGYAALFAVVGVAAIALWGVRPRDSDFMTTFPYEYVGDLEERPPEAELTHGQRLGFAVALGGAVFVAWMLLGATWADVAVAVVPAAFCVVWTFEISQWPEPWRLRIAVRFGAFVGLGVAALGSLLAPSTGEALAGAVLAAVTTGSFLLIGLTLVQVGRRTPHRLL